MTEQGSQWESENGIINDSDSSKCETWERKDFWEWLSGMR